VKLVLLVALLAAACSGHGSSEPAAPVVAAPPPVAQVVDAALADTAAAGSGSAGSGSAVAAPAPAADLVVVARISDASPIGDGRCSQRSYQVAVDHVVSGPPPRTSVFWVHFELCGGAPPPGEGNLAGTGLVSGTSYKLTLRKGASKNFKDALMIIDARAP
jgi:hypothetical protein